MVGREGGIVNLARHQYQIGFGQYKTFYIPFIRVIQSKSTYLQSEDSITIFTQTPFQRHTRPKPIILLAPDFVACKGNMCILMWTDCFFS